MYARVATFTDSDPDRVREMVDGIGRQVRDGAPEGVPMTGGLVLHTPAERRVITIALFATEEDLREGDATLSAVDPPVSGGFGRRQSVALYEVPLTFEL